MELLASGGETYPPTAILIVDDDAGNLLALEGVLAPLGHTIVAARSGTEAIARAAERPFGLAFVDVAMRGMDGFETVAHLRQLETTRATPVVFVTGYADSASHMHRGYAAGAIDYVTKPLDPDLLRLKAASFILLYQRGEELKRRALEVATAESARKAAEEFSQKQGFLADASRVLVDASLDPEAALAHLARAAVPAIADWFRIDLIQENGEGKQIAAGLAAGMAGRAGLQRVRAGWTRARAVMSSGQADFVPDAAAPARAGGPGLTEAELRDLREAGVTSFIVVPMGARGRILGAITLLRAGPGTAYQQGDLDFARELASRAALALENTRLYRLAERAAAAREELLAVVSHDLQNPLMALLMKASLIQRLVPSDEVGARIARSLEGIVRAGRQMSDLLKVLMDATAIEKGRMTVELQSCDPADLAREAAEMLGPMAAERNIALQLDLPPGLPPIHADRSRVFQVLSNLLGNAVKYTGAGGQVTLRLNRSDDQVSFCVTDTGKGIAPEHLPRLFDRYWQVDRKRDGLGLGLYISKGIVEAHGGEITVASTPGQGSAFSFSLPVSRAAVGAIDPPPEARHFEEV